MNFRYNKELSVLENIRSFCFSFTYPFRRTYRYIKKVFTYAKMLWTDWDWDWSSLLRIMQFKISVMRKEINRRSFGLCSQETIAQMTHAEALIQKILEDDFCTKEFEEHDKKWGKYEELFVPVDVNGEKMFEFNPTRTNTTTEELRQQERAEIRKLYDKSEQEKQKCFDDLFAHLRKYIQYWWD